MAIMKDIAAGLAVLMRYQPDGDACAEHDELTACDVPPSKMSSEHLAALETAGWFWSENEECWMTFT